MLQQLFTTEHHNLCFSLTPLEGGIAWSRAGPVATGTLLTGLASALQPKRVEWLPYSYGGGNRNI